MKRPAMLGAVGICCAVLADTPTAVAQANGMITREFFGSDNSWRQLETGSPPWSDSSNWDAAEYYSTIQTAVLNDALYLLARGTTGIQLYKFDPSSGTWSEEGSGHPALSDASGWDKPENYSTIQTAVVNDQLYLLARSGDGMRWWEFQPNSTTDNKWSEEMSGPGLTDASGWDKPENYSTIQSAVVNDQLYLLARSGNGIRWWEFQPNSTADYKWSEEMSGPGLTDASGWDKPENYLTIQTAVLPSDFLIFEGKDVLYLLARATAGMRLWWLDGSTWVELANNNPGWSTAAGWNNGAYYSTIQTAVANNKLYLLARGTAEPPGQQLTDLTNSTVVTPYPKFTGARHSVYERIVSEYNAKIKGVDKPITDFRTDVYPAYADSYADLTSDLGDLTDPPPGLPSKHATDWSLVITQLQTEAGILHDLWNTGNPSGTMQANVVSVNTALSGGFRNAQQYLVRNETGTFNLVGFLADAVWMVGGALPDLSPVTTTIGAVLGMASYAEPSGEGATGNMATLSAELTSSTDALVTDSQGLYINIQNDWGRLQRFRALNEQFSDSFDQATDFTTLGNFYEISLYKALIPSTMAMAFYAETLAGVGSQFGACSTDDGDWALVYPNGIDMPEEANTQLCERLTGTLGVSIDQVKSWPKLPSLFCCPRMTGSGTPMNECGTGC